ncbi:MAG: hypothetical protein ACQEQD_06750 [Bacillota bacterium]
MNFEIERKFVPKKKERVLYEKVEPIKYILIKQWYLKIKNNEEKRIRSINNGEFYIETIKKGKGLKREEKERVISFKEYKNLKNKIDDKKIPIMKKRYVFKYDGIVCALDAFWCFDNLRIIEVEFNNKEKAESFNPPEWFGKEVTDKESYKNKILYKNLNNKIK